MAMTLTRPSVVFTIEDVPVYGSLRCSASSPRTRDSLEAFDFSREQGMRLQSVAEAVLVRSAFFDDAQKNKGASLDFSDEYQKTCTVSLKYRDGSDIVSVFAELDSSDESRELLRQGLDSHVAGTELFLPVTDGIVARLLQTGRKVSSLGSVPLRCSVEERAGGSDYSGNKFNSALFGSSEFAEVNASYLRSRGKTEGFSYDFSKAQLEGMLKGKEGMVLVRPVGLGGDDYVSIVVNAGNFDDHGCARGFTCVEKKNSPQEMKVGVC